MLANGRRFRVVSAKDFFGPPLMSGTYDGKAVRVPIKVVTPPPPVGMPGADLPVTEPRFAALVVLPD